MSNSNEGPSVETRPPPACPMHQPEKKPQVSECPIEHEKLNPDNFMPYLKQDPAPDQEAPLPTERVVSSIPKAVVDDNSNNWEYPSPQQFYNALRRKGKQTDEKSVEMMVDIHNFLNEGCWDEILKWEKLHENKCGEPKLLRFMGRPDRLSPKARVLGWFGTPPPFDRHDWVVDRCGKEVRYVIDYYGGVDDPESDTPVFHVDVRPAVDSLGSAWDRVRMAWREKFNEQ